jgi:two-component system OmpR family response regulator
LIRPPADGIVADAMSAKILIVDDNQELLVLLSRLVEQQGWKPVPVGRGKSAIDAIPVEQPAAAVVDVLLPDMMGYDVGAALRKAGIPFIFMTGVFKGGRAASDARAQHGAAAYFEKPFDSQKLVDALRGLVPAATPQAPARSSAPPPPPPLEEKADFDVELAVEADEPVDAMELTGKVVLTEDGKVSAVLKGETITAAPVAVPSRSPSPRPSPPPPAAEVRRQATDLSKTEGALHDNVPDLITAFYLAGQTGELTLQKGKVKKSIYFEKGRPVFAISNLLSDRFGPFLVRVGKITQSQLELCTAAAEKTGRRTGDVLVEMGLLKDTEKLYYVAQQVKAIVYSVFGWEEGQYRLHFTDRAAKEAIKIDLHPAHLIVRGIKKLYKPERLYRLLAPDDKLIPTQQPNYSLHEVELERWEAELLPKIDGSKRIADLIAATGRPEHAVYGFLCGMVSLKILERC